MGQLVVSVVGAVAGFFIGGPAGAKWGWAIGSTLGSAFAPGQHNYGPRLEDLSVSSSAYGTTIPFVQGSPRVPAQIVWASKKREIATTVSQGKGGKKNKTTTYTYEVDVFILLSDNPIPGVDKVWHNGKLVWNKSSDATPETVTNSDSIPEWNRLTVYKGGPTQMPDPVYEAAVAPLTCAFRDRGGVFIEKLQLLGSSGQLPQLSFEIGSTAPVLSVGASAFVAAGTFAQTDSVAMSLTKAIVVFREIGSPFAGSVSVNNPSGNTISHGSVYSSQSASITNPRISPISSTKALFSWSNTTGSLFGYAAILNVSGDVVTTATPRNYASFLEHADGILMSATKAIVVYTSGGIKAMVLDIDGADNITTNAVFSSGLPTSGVSHVGVAKLSSSSIFVTWVASGPFNTLRGVVLSLSGSVLMSGGVMDLSTDAIVGLGTSTHNSVAMSPGQALVVVGEQSTNYPQALLVTTGGGATNPYRIVPYVASYLSLAKINSSYALCVFTRVSDGHLMAVVLGAEVGTVLELVAASVTCTTVAMLSTNKAICTYIDSANDLRSVVITLS